MALVAYGTILMAMGKFEEAVRVMRRAMELDPLSPAINLHWAGALFVTRQYDQVIEQLKKTLELDPNVMPRSVKN